MARYRDFLALYRAQVEGVYRMAFAQLGTREEAEDITAAVFEEALVHVQLQRDEKEIAAWLRQVGRAAIARHWREQYQLPREPLEPWHDREEATELTTPASDDRRARVQRLLARLQDNYHDVLRLRFLDGLSLRETAASMGTTEGNVKVLQFRALKKALEMDQR